MINKHLILLTNSFPYGNGEAFLETEILFLANKFEKIYIINSSSHDQKKRIVSKNVYIKRLGKKKNSFLSKILLLKYLLNPIIIKEFFFIHNRLKKKVSIFKIKKILFSYSNAQYLKKEIIDLVERHSLGFKDTVFYSYWMDVGSIALAQLKNENVNYKCITRTHRWDLYFEENNENYLALRPFILENIKCYSISKDGANYLNYLLNINSVKVSKLGINKVLKNKLMPQNYFVVVSCSFLVQVKRVDLIIKSIANISKLKIKWIHFGGGPLINELKSLANKNQIEFEFKGNISNEKVLAFLQFQKVDLFLNLSSSEGIPVSIMEAMACAIPVMATNVGGVSEIVNNKNGVLLSPTISIDDITFAMIDFLKKPENEMIEFKNNAYRTWEILYNSEINYTNFSEILLNL